MILCISIFQRMIFFISDSQVSGNEHSTETALIQIIDGLLFNLDNDRVNGLVLVDYRKAFDMVDHEILLKKLKAYGVVDTSLSWFHSYLHDRHQLVSIAGTNSDYAHIKHGVPQGSILGPLLFIVFINDLPLHVNSSQVDLYADDTTLSSSADVKNIVKLQDALNSSMTEVHDWAISNRLPINEKKTKTLIVTGKRLSSKLDCSPIVNFDGNLLSKVDSAKLLGLEIDKELSFLPHVENVCKKLSQRIGVLRKIRGYLPLKQRLLYYNSMIRPVINYVAVVWTNCDKELLGRVLRMQKRAARIILNVDQQSSSVVLFNTLGWLPFYEEAKINKLILAFKRLKGNVPSYLSGLLKRNCELHSRTTRYSQYNLVCPSFKRKLEGGRSFSVTTCQFWNSLPLALRQNDSLTTFTNSLRNYFLDNQKNLNHFIV